jgi:hypothetical protein
MTRIKSLFEHLGLDWFLVLAKDIEIVRRESLPSVSFDTLDDAGKVDDALEFCNALAEKVQDRIQRIEAKATSLAGFAGAIMALTASLGGFLIDPSKGWSTTALIIAAAILFFLVVVALLITLLVALRTVDVFLYKQSEVAARDIFDLCGSATTLLSVKRQRATDLFKAYEANVYVAREKATYLGGAQLWFRNALALLFLLSLTVGTQAVTSAVQKSRIAPTPTPTPQASPPLAQATPVSTGSVTATPSPSPTSVAAGLTPTPTNRSAPTPLPTTPIAPAPTPGPKRTP